MPAGNASHKSTSVKPNINADGIIDEAADLSLDPEDVLLNEEDDIEAEPLDKRNVGATKIAQLDETQK